jgi:hypothetical protein
MLDERNKSFVTERQIHRDDHIFDYKVVDVGYMIEVLESNYKDSEIKIIDFGGNNKSLYNTIIHRSSICDKNIINYTIVEVDIVYRYLAKHNKDPRVHPCNYLRELTDKFDVAIMKACIVYFTDEELIEILNYFVDVLGVKYIFISATGVWLNNSEDYDFINTKAHGHEQFVLRKFTHFNTNIIQKLNKYLSIYVKKDINEAGEVVAHDGRVYADFVAYQVE